MDTLRQNMFPSMQGVVDCLFGFNATVSTLFGATVNLGLVSARQTPNRQTFIQRFV